MEMKPNLDAMIKQLDIEADFFSTPVAHRLNHGIAKLAKRQPKLTDAGSSPLVA